VSTNRTLRCVNLSVAPAQACLLLLLVCLLLLLVLCIYELGCVCFRWASLRWRRHFDTARVQVGLRRGARALNRALGAIFGYWRGCAGWGRQAKLRGMYLAGRRQVAMLRRALDQWKRWQLDHARAAFVSGASWLQAQVGDERTSVAGAPLVGGGAGGERGVGGSRGGEGGKLGISSRGPRGAKPVRLVRKQTAARGGQAPACPPSSGGGGGSSHLASGSTRSTPSERSRSSDQSQVNIYYYSQVNIYLQVNI
jgi:hypothetical protein